jgi:muconolactone delta-isomerase
MKILAIDKIAPGVDPQRDIYPHLRDEAMRAWELHTQGVIREMYFKAEHGGAVLMLECADAAEARQVLDTLPLVKAGLVDFDIIPLGPFVPLTALFAPSQG